jgi:hypothetical protein
MRWVRAHRTIVLVTALALVAGCGSSTAPSLSARPPAPPVPQQSSASTEAPPTATPVPTPVPTPSPPLDPFVGQVVVTVSDNIVVRSEPRVSHDSTIYKPWLPLGTALTVLDGPVRASGYTWYKVAPVTFAGLSGPGYGWVAMAGKDGDAWIAPSGANHFTWTSVGHLDVGRGEFLGLIRLSSGYVAWGHAFPDGVDPDDGGQSVLATWTSPDLRSWTRTLHRTPIAWCKGWSPGPELERESAASDGTTLVIVAEQAAPDPTVEGGCGMTEFVSLSTRDGVTWTRSASGVHLAPEGVWPIPGGWEIQALESEGAVSVWQTEDLRTWRLIGAARALNAGENVLAVADDGTRLTAGEVSDGPALLGSADGVTWRTVRTLPAESTVSGILSPADGDERWVVGLERDGKNAELLFSPDLRTWAGSTFPSQGIASVLRTSDGWIAVGYRPNDPPVCEGDPLICPMGVPEQFRDPVVYTSSDGRTWTKHPELLLPKGHMPDLVPDGTSALGLDALPGDWSRQGSDGLIKIWRLDSTR